MNVTLATSREDQACPQRQKESDEKRTENGRGTFDTSRPDQRFTLGEHLHKRCNQICKTLAPDCECDRRFSTSLRNRGNQEVSRHFAAGYWSAVCAFVTASLVTRRFRRHGACRSAAARLGLCGWLAWNRSKHRDSQESHHHDACNEFGEILHRAPIFSADDKVSL